MSRLVAIPYTFSNVTLWAVEETDSNYIHCYCDTKQQAIDKIIEIQVEYK